MTFTWAPLHAGVVNDWADPTNVPAEVDRTKEFYTADDLAEELRKPGVNPALDTVAAWQEDRLIAFGQVRVVGTVLLVNRRRAGVPVMASFLVVEALIYLVHNLSGAAGRDLPTNDPVLFVASLLGYLNAVAAILFLGWLFRARRGTQAGSARS